MAEFNIAGTDYSSKMLDGETQLLVMKRLLPTFTALVGAKPLLDGGPAEGAGDDGVDPGEPLSVHDLLMPVAREMAAIKDADVTYILNACMDVTRRRVKTGTGWVGVRQGGLIQDRDDAKFATRLAIAYHVLGENFGEVLGSFGLDVSKLTGLTLPLG